MNKLIFFLVTAPILGLLFFRFGVVPGVINKGGVLVDFKHLVTPSSPNFYLLCPKNYCLNAKEQGVSPLYTLSRQDLQSAWDKMIKGQARTKLLKMNQEGTQRVYVQYSKWWHFPDFINVEFIDVSPNQTRLALYSHSYFGHSDFGVNRARIKDWLNDLDEITKG